MRVRDQERRRVQRARSVTLAVGFLPALAAWHTVLDAFGWFMPLAALATFVFVITGTVRWLTGSSWLPTLAGAVLSGAIVIVAFASRTTLFAVIPTPDTWDRLSELARLGVNSISVQNAPAHVDVGMMLLLCLIVAGGALLADLLAVTLNAPALSGLVLLAMLGVPVTTGLNRGDPFLFVLTGIAFLLLLRAGKPHRDRGQTVALAALTVVTALLVPVVLPAVTDETSTRPSGILSGVNPVLDLGQNLRRDAERSVLSYETTAGPGEYLRLVSLDDFTAQTWQPSESTLDPERDPIDMGNIPGLDETVITEAREVAIDVGNLGSAWLPVPYPATSVEGLIGEWSWNPDDLTVASDTQVARGQSYVVQVVDVLPTPTQLAEAGPGPDDLMERYTALPEGLPSIIAETAFHAVGDAPSRYEQALALQEYLRSGDFEYSEETPVEQGFDGNGMDALEVFLSVRSGYCVHYASAMAVMARVLDIPSRVAVGTLPGSSSKRTLADTRLFSVSTSDVHAWPELYFEGIGWVRFEPTPGRGFLPDYSNELLPGVPEVRPPVTPAPTATPRPTESPGPSDAPVLPDRTDDTPATSGELAGLWWAAGITAGALVLLLIPAAMRMLQRRVRLRRLERGAPLASTGWREIVQTAHDLGLSVPDTLTPRAASAMLNPSRSDHQLADAVATLEREAFAPPAGGANGGRDDAVRMVITSLRQRTVWWRRWLATFAPRSLWRGLWGLVPRRG